LSATTAGAPDLGSASLESCANVGSARVEEFATPNLSVVNLDSIASNEKNVDSANATYSTVVDTLNDSFNLDDGVWSLREAIYYAPEYVTITFVENLSGELTLTRGELVVDKALVIDGDGRIVIDADGNSRVAYVASGTTDASVVFNGLTLQNGNTMEEGGGVYVYKGSLTLTNSTVSGNSAFEGGGVLVNGGSLTLTNSTVSGNSVYSGEYGCSPGDGGGVYVVYGSLTLINSTVSGNSASFGGGVNVYDSSLTLTNSTVSGNSAESNGGISANYYSSLTLTNSTVSGNSAEHEGGGICVDYNSSLTMTNSIVSGNSAEYGGGVCVWNEISEGGVTLTNSTVSGNSAEYGGGVYVLNAGTFIARNTILSLNYGGNLDGLLSASSTNNLIDDDPSFVCAPEFDESGVLTNGKSLDFRLRDDSPAIDAGDDQSAYDAALTVNSINLASKARFVGSSIDIGAYENQNLAERLTRIETSTSQPTSGVKITTTLYVGSTAKPSATAITSGIE